MDFDNRILPLSIQAELLSLNRSSLYCTPTPPSDSEILIKHGIDRIYTDNPSFGSRRIAVVLNREGIDVSRPTVQKHMREMGICAIYPKANLSKRNHQHKIYPYLLNGVKASYPNHVWGTDITYIKLQKGWLYLVAFIDWFSRYVIAWELDFTLEVDFVMTALGKALLVAKPAIINSDQGCQYTSSTYTEFLTLNGIKISMDGKNRAIDNIFTERLWRSLKYEEVYPNCYESPRNARTRIGGYFDKYNNYRPHQSLGYLTPVEVYFRNYAINTSKTECIIAKTPVLLQDGSGCPGPSGERRPATRGKERLNKELCQ